MGQLTCQNLRLGYDGREIIHDLSFTVEGGDYLCILGENGSGKSTLMKTILGLQPPLSGKVLTGDSLAPNEIGYLPQQTIVQKDFPASVWEIVLSGCCALLGILISILAGTPVGSTIVGVDIVAFVIFTIIGSFHGGTAQ